MSSNREFQSLVFHRTRHKVDYFRRDFVHFKTFNNPLLQNHVYKCRTFSSLILSLDLLVDQLQKVIHAASFLFFGKNSAAFK